MKEQKRKQKIQTEFFLKMKSLFEISDNTPTWILFLPKHTCTYATIPLHRGQTYKHTKHTQALIHAKNKHETQGAFISTYRNKYFLSICELFKFTNFIVNKLKHIDEIPPV